jgi:lysyl-tRNA synthetase class 2
MTEKDKNEHRLISERRRKLEHIKETSKAYPNDFQRTNLSIDIFRLYSQLDKKELEETPKEASLAGRLMSKREMGKSSFAHIQDSSGSIQLFVNLKYIEEGAFELFKTCDIGDIIGVKGLVFKTKTGELSIKVNTLRLLTKSLRPLPEKFHGLKDQELRYRQRYVDLIMNNDVRETFITRSKIVRSIRSYFDNHDFLEVETPMMQTLPGGALAQPFITHHNALDLDLYLRVAPELYLKRLIVGGFEKVYEINRNFRNEGLSSKHNPEFTMLEFYQAYSNYEDLMNMTENLLSDLVKNLFNDSIINYQGKSYDFSKPFERITMQDAVCKYNDNIKKENIHDANLLLDCAKDQGLNIKSDSTAGKILLEIFEKTVEPKLLEPTFITSFPADVSPLARRSDQDSTLADRFELFIAGYEIANGFSELNDSADQAQRFQDQVAEKDTGDKEAMYYDSDYICALEYGMPPAAGEGIGIDRLVMLLTDAASIRDVLLFPLLKPKK